MKEPMTPLQILESIPEGVFATDPNCLITYFNQKAEEITGYRRELVLGRRCADVFRTENCESNCTIKQCMNTGKELFDQRVNILDRWERASPVLIQTSPLRDEAGSIVGGLQAFHVIENPDEETRRGLILFELRRKMGSDRRLGELYETLPDLAQSDAPVLLQGEPGTEKQLLARAIHFLSARASGPYFHVACLEKSPEDLTRELLGAWSNGGDKEGSDLTGSLQKAHRGTLFLDGIEALPYPLQVSLFRAMEEGEYTPPGAQDLASSDIRLIASTQTDLERRVREGTFPESLFYCLNVFKIHVPPLRERKEVIPTLARDILWRLSLETERIVTAYDEEVGQVLESHPFPGNLHELEEILKKGHQAAAENILRKKDLPTLPCQEKVIREKAPGGGGSHTGGSERAAERERILEVLARNRWNRKRTAQELGMDRTTLWRRMKRVGIHPGSREIKAEEKF